MVVVVFPTPPFWLAIAMMRATAPSHASRLKVGEPDQRVTQSTKPYSERPRVIHIRARPSTESVDIGQHPRTTRARISGQYDSHPRVPASVGPRERRASVTDNEIQIERLAALRAQSR